MGILNFEELWEIVGQLQFATDLLIGPKITTCCSQGAALQKKCLGIGYQPILKGM